MKNKRNIFYLLAFIIFLIGIIFIEESLRGITGFSIFNVSEESAGGMFGLIGIGLIISSGIVILIINSLKREEIEI